MMQFGARVIPVDGVTGLPGIDEVVNFDGEMSARRQQRSELLLLNVATGLSVLMVCCAWMVIALE